MSPPGPAPSISAHDGYPLTTLKFIAALLLTLPVTLPVAMAAPVFDAKLRPDTQTLARLSPLADRGFDFLPSHLAAQRRGDGYAHLGDLNLRLRSHGGEWREFSSYRKRVAVKAIDTSAGELGAADISATLGAELPLRVIRRWRIDGRALVLTFELSNRAGSPIEIGALGMPLVFDNILSDRTLDQAHTQASFADPSIANDAGYVQVTRLNGQGPAWLVSPRRTHPFEASAPAARRRHEARTHLEGFHEWMVASRAYAEQEWRNGGEPWNPPTSFKLRRVNRVPSACDSSPRHPSVPSRTC